LADTDVYRIFHGPTEGQDGVTISRVGEGAILEHAVELEGAEGEWADALMNVHSFRWIVARSRIRNSTTPGAISSRVLVGSVPDEGVAVQESGLHFIIHPRSGGHVGLFLDARPVRQWIRHNSRDRRVLNLFAATGSLGVAAAKGEARRVCHVDQQRLALLVAHENHALNGVPIDGRDIIRGNLYPHLKRAARHGQRFDAVILDPPPAVSTGGLKRPVGQDYAALGALVAPLLAPHAWLLCLFHQRGRRREECEEEVLRSAALADLEVHWRGESGLDFPESDPHAPMRATAFVRR